MCLAVPGKILSITNEDPFRMAVVDFIGVQREVCINTVDAKVGDYIIVHAGVALSVMSRENALQTIEDLETMTRYDEENNR